MSVCKSFFPISNKNRPRSKTPFSAFSATAMAVMITFTSLSQSALADIAQSRTDAIASNSGVVHSADSDKANDYGDLNDDGSHAKDFRLLYSAGNDGSDDQAPDYGDIDDDGSHVAPRTSHIVADKKGSGDKATDYGDLNDDGSHILLLIEPSYS